VQDFSHHTCQSRVVSSPDFMWCFLIIVLFYATVYYVLANLCLRMLFILSMSLWFDQHFNCTYIFIWIRKFDSDSFTETKIWSGRNEIIETSGRLHPSWPQNERLYTPWTKDYRHTRQYRWIQAKLAFTLAKNATKPNPVEIIPLQTTWKEYNWKTEETLARTVVTQETERIRLVQSFMFMMMMMMMIWCCNEWSCCLAWNNRGDIRCGLMEEPGPILMLNSVSKLKNLTNVTDAETN